MYERLHFGNEVLRLNRVTKIKETIEGAIRNEKPENVAIETSVRNLMENYQELIHSNEIEKSYLSKSLTEPGITGFRKNALEFSFNSMNLSISTLKQAIQDLRGLDKETTIECYNKVLGIISNVEENYSSIYEIKQNVEYESSDDYGFTIKNLGDSAPVLFKSEDIIKSLFRKVLNELSSNRVVNFLEINKNRDMVFIDASMIEEFNVKNYAVLRKDSHYRRHNNLRNENFERLIRSELKTCTISNKAFDISYCEMAEYIVGSVNYYEDETGDVAENLRHEDKENGDLLDRIIRYTKPNGLIVTAVPTFKLTNKTCNDFAKHCSEAVKIKLDTKKIDYCILIGKKAEAQNAKPDARIYNKLRFEDPIEIESVDDPKVAFISLFNTSNTVVNDFRSYILSEEEAEVLLDSIDSLGQVITLSNDIKGNIDDKQPLLPFNIGQIGIVLTSGCLDGVVEEKDGTHMVKGRIVRVVEEKTEKEKNGKGYKTETIYSNKVSINLLTPDGEFKKLV